MLSQLKTAIRDLAGAEQPADAKRGALYATACFAIGYLCGRADAGRGR